MSSDGSYDRRQESSTVSVDRPSGRTYDLASAITGQPLHYFTPDPLSDLLLRTQPELGVGTPLPHDGIAALILARSASVKGASDEVDLHQAQRFCELILHRQHFQTTNDFLDLGGRISARATGLREQIVFSGGPTASQANHIYAPDIELPRLMKALEECLHHDDIEIDPLTITAITGFYCVHVHPFLDGNGRWARLVATSAGIRAGSPVAAMINTTFQTACREELASDIWPESRRFGLRAYLDLAHQFDSHMRAGFDASGLLRIANALCSAFSKKCRDRRHYASMLEKLFVRGGIDIQTVRTCCGLSTRALSGFVDELITSAEGMADATEVTLNINTMLAQASMLVERSKHLTLKGIINE